jgi:hypothetical protein
MIGYIQQTTPLQQCDIPPVPHFRNKQSHHDHRFIFPLYPKFIQTHREELPLPIFEYAGIEVFNEATGEEQESIFVDSVRNLKEYFGTYWRGAAPIIIVK